MDNTDDWTTVKYKHKIDRTGGSKASTLEVVSSEDTGSGFKSGYQDWDEFILHGVGNGGGGKKKEVVRSPRASDEAIKLAKLAAEMDPTAQQKVKPALSKKIQTYRQEHKMTRAELAFKMNVKEEVVRDYENGSAIPDGIMLMKFNRLFTMTESRKRGGYHKN